jgi:hypothetical protein
MAFIARLIRQGRTMNQPSSNIPQQQKEIAKA